MDFIWDISQESRIHGAASEARRATSKADAVVQEYARLQRRLERLSLATQAMWELLRDNSGLTERCSRRSPTAQTAVPRRTRNARCA